MNKLIWNLNYHKFEIGLVTVVILLLIGLGYAAIEENKQWEAFKIAHDCRVVGKQKGHVSTGYVSTGNGGGVVTTVSPDKTGWECNEGVTYWR